MRITKKNLRKLIREDVFDQSSFPYRIGDEIEIRDSGRGTTFWARVVKPLKNGVRIKDESGWVGTVKYQDVMPSKLVQKTMDVNIMPEGGAMGRYEPQKRRTYNQVSDSTKAMANAVKRKFLKLYDAEVKIDGRAGWITVNGKKAVNISSASGSPTSMEDMLSQMEDAMWGDRSFPAPVGKLREEMLKIISNPYSPETETFNRIANYALNNDIKGALADPEVNTSDLDLDLDSMGEWIHRVGKGGNWMSDDVVVPDGWNADKVSMFMEDLESAWYKQQGQKSDTEHQDTPDIKEREAIGGVLTQNYVLPDEFPGITYQIRRKGGKPHRIDIESRNIYSGDGIDASWAKQHGTTIDKIIAVLDKYGAKLRKKNPPRKHTPPMYD